MSSIDTPEPFYQFTIVKRKDGYHVISESTGKNLGGPYKTRTEAEKRLKQIDYFKYLKKKGKK